MEIIKDKFRVQIGKLWDDQWPTYFDRFWTHCTEIAHANGWAPATVANYELRPMGGRLITTKTQGWYLRWNREEDHTLFVLKWQ